MHSSKKVYRILLFTICISIMLISSVSPKNFQSNLEATPPEPPLLPSEDPNDYILGFYYMFFTGDYSLLDKMIGAEGTRYYLPSGIEFFTNGENNSEEVKSEFQNASITGNSQCIGLESSQAKFTVYFRGVHFKGFEEDTIPFFIFMKNGDGYWDFLVIGYMDDFENGNLDACPINELDFPEERGVPEWYLKSFETTPTLSFTDYPPDNDGQIEKDESRSFFSRLIKQVYAADICTPRRNKIDDNNADFIQCVEYVQQIRPDALCWLDYEAYAYKWDDYAIQYGSDIVSVSNEPLVGDIAVWNRECGGEYSANGHVAIVTNVTENSSGQVFIDVDEANANFTGTIGSRTDIPVHVCMKFIHEPGINTNTGESSDQAISEVPSSKKDSWLQSFLCFINPWCD